MDGFYVGNKFLVREIGWYAPLPNGQEAYGVQHITHDWTWDMLSFKDQQRVRYVKRHVTGFRFDPPLWNINYRTITYWDRIVWLVLLNNCGKRTRLRNVIR